MGRAERAAAICCSRSVIGGAEGTGVPDSCKKLSSSVGTSSPLVMAGAEGVASGVGAFVTMGASTGTRTTLPQLGHGIFSFA